MENKCPVCGIDIDRRSSFCRKHHIFTDEQRKKMSIAKMGNRAMLGKKMSIEARRKIGLSRRGNTDWLGKKHSKETIEKMRQSHLGKRHSLESKKKNSESHKGEKCNWWKGGISFEPYSVDWTNTLKRAIRERDKYTCQICGEEPAISCHHIDYNKKNCNSDNLITLCVSCHSKTNQNRNYWVKYFETRK